MRPQDEEADLKNLSSFISVKLSIDAHMHTLVGVIYCTERSESRCALRLRYVDVVVSI
jgi:hypothetical protein